MLLSIAVIMLSCIIINYLFKKIRIPPLIGMLILGILLQEFNLIDSKLLGISNELIKIALIVILLKAGLSLDLNVLKKVGRPAILMCFVPATFEIIGVTIFGVLILHLGVVQSLLIGTVLGAVSPAVVVPRMTSLIDGKIGTNKGIPQMIIAGSSADDVYSIVLFTVFTGLLSQNNETNNIMKLLQIPSSIIFGIGIGILIGFVLSYLFKKVHIRDTIKLIILISISFIMCFVEDILNNTIISISSMLVVITMGIMIYRKSNETATHLRGRLDKIWVVAQMFLFVLVGTKVQIHSITSVGISVIIVLLIGMLFRMIGTFICLIKTKLNKKEKLFVMFSEIPKATVQAAIGGTLIGISGINQDYASLVLTISVIAIIMFAPMGAILMDLTANKLLQSSD